MRPQIPVRGEEWTTHDFLLTDSLRMLIDLESIYQCTEIVVVFSAIILMLAIRRTTGAHEYRGDRNLVKQGDIR